jgi:transposase
MRRWLDDRRKDAGDGAAAFIPLMFRPGEAYQFDWSHEDVEIAGKPMRVKVAHMRLCASRAVFVRAYPRETQEMVFDAHARAFDFFGGVPTRGIYDNMKTAVTTVFTGKERVFNRRFLIMADHYMIEPTACSPAAGWEKGQVEHQVQTIRGRFFQPRLRFASLEELNGWLEAECRRWAALHPHPDQRELTIADAWDAERPVSGHRRFRKSGHLKFPSLAGGFVSVISRDGDRAFPLGGPRRFGKGGGLMDGAMRACSGRRSACCRMR